MKYAALKIAWWVVCAIATIAGMVIGLLLLASIMEPGWMVL